LIEKDLSRSMLASIQRLEAGRQGEFMANAEDGTCQACYVRVRPQGFQEVKLATKIHFCGNCKRVLYHQPTLCPEKVEEIAPAPVEATD
jgi:predicted  nucleic acid-binding Zn-ribbon protein